MAQVDFLNYFPILFWFFFLIIIYYILNYSYILPGLYSILYIRFFLLNLYLIKIKYKFNFYFKYSFNFFYYKFSLHSYLLVIKSYIYLCT